MCSNPRGKRQRLCELSSIFLAHKGKLGLNISLKKRGVGDISSQAVSQRWMLTNHVSTLAHVDPIQICNISYVYITKFYIWEEKLKLCISMHSLLMHYSKIISGIFFSQLIHALLYK